MPAWEFEIIADNRERYVIRHPEIGLYKSAQLSVGDFAIVRHRAGVDTHICAIIERKELTDFAASLKDGRHNNKEKMINLRAKTGCAVYYIIEGDIKAKGVYGGIPYKNIQSAIDHLQFRDNIHVIYTLDTIATALRLRDLATNLCTLEDYPAVNNAFVGAIMPADALAAPADALAAPVDALAAPMDTPADALADPFDSNVKVGGQMAPMSIENITALLTSPVRASDRDTLREMWASFKGISVISADEFIVKWSVGDIIRGVPPAEIAAHKTAGGRKVSKSVIMSLSRVDIMTQIRLLGRVPGISAPTARKIIGLTPLRDLIGGPVEQIAARIVGKRAIGLARAAVMLKFFAYKHDNLPDTGAKRA